MLWSPFDIEVEPDSFVQPDIFVLPIEEWTRLVRDARGRSLRLAIEVTSPSSAKDDPRRKRR